MSDNNPQDIIGNLQTAIDNISPVVQGAISSAVADVPPIDLLVALAYIGNIRLKLHDEFIYAYHPQQGHVGASDFAYRLSPKSGIPGNNTIVDDSDTVFRLELGHYTGGVTGYWVRYLNMAWQAIPNSGFTFWNNDHRARGNPEDDEMFYFEAIDRDKNLVRIRSRYCNYLYLSGSNLNVGADVNQAATFEVIFT